MGSLSCPSLLSYYPVFPFQKDLNRLSLLPVTIIRSSNMNIPRVAPKNMHDGFGNLRNVSSENKIDVITLIFAAAIMGISILYGRK